MKENEIGKQVIGAAISVHRELGPGLLESVYEVALAHELRSRSLRVERQVAVPLQYKDVKFDEGFRLDLCVDDRVVVEIKCTEQVHDVHKKQLLTYLRLSGIRLGYLMNFSVLQMKSGITRIVNNLEE